MITTEASARIERPVDQVFAYVTDVRNDPNWHVDIVEAIPESDGPIAAGKRYRLKIKPFMGNSEGTMTVSRFEPSSCFELDGAMGPMKPHIEYRFDPEDGGTRFTRRLAVQPTGWMRLMQPMMSGMMSKRNAQFVANLAEVLGKVDLRSAMDRVPPTRRSAGLR